MKRKILIIMSMILVLSMTACGAKQETSESDENATAENVANEDSTAENTDAVPLDEFKTYFSTVELTTENWQDYFEIVEIKDEYVDSFDEPTGRYDIGSKIQSKPNTTVWGDDVVFRFNVSYTYESGNYSTSTDEKVGGGEDPTDTEETRDVTLSQYHLYSSILTVEEVIPSDDDETQVWKNIKTINEIVCTKISGNVLVSTMPESVWSENNGEKCVIVDDGEGYYYLYEDGSCEYNGCTSSVAAESGGGYDDLPAFAKWNLLKELLEK